MTEDHPHDDAPSVWSQLSGTVAMTLGTCLLIAALLLGSQPH